MPLPLPANEPPLMARRAAHLARAVETRRGPVARTREDVVRRAFRAFGHDAPGC